MPAPIATPSPSDKPHEKRAIRLFISSPGDVEMERQRTKRLIERIARDYTAWGELLPYFWEHEPHDPSVDFTTSIGPTSDYDIVVVILWSRLGNRLHSAHRKKDGEVFRSGTEYEVLTALEAQKRPPGGLPRLAVFLNTSPVSVDLSQDKSKRDEIQGQYDALREFFTEHFQASEAEPDGKKIFTNRRAFSAYETLDRFEELLEKSLRGAVEGLLGIDPPRAGVGAPGVRPEPTWEGNPFLGLDVFEARHAPLYFGRTRAIGETVERVRERFGSGRGFLLVFGASGSGKSSLVRAGLLPLATQPGVVPGVGLWRQAVMKPSDGASDPFLALAAALLAGGALPGLADRTLTTPEDQLDKLADQLRQGAAGVLGRIEVRLEAEGELERERQMATMETRAKEFAASGRAADAAAERERAVALAVPQAGLFLVLDQMEELWTIGLTPESRVAFLDTLAGLAGSRAVMVVATLRSDFYEKCEGHAGLMALKDGRGSYHLESPTRVELEQMIREPARAAGVVFEEEGEKGRLEGRLLAAAEADPDSLPLLEFCLWKLYETGHGDGVLTHAEYEGIGQLAGVLTQHAEAVFDDLKSHEQGALEEVIRALATLGRVESGAGTAGDSGRGKDTSSPSAEAVPVVRRVVPYEAVVESMPGARGLVDRFIAERLFTGGMDTAGRRVVAVTHEALLRKWGKVSAWLGLDENRRFLAVRARVGERLVQWSEGQKDDSFLLQSGRDLEEAEREFADYPRAFHEAERDFILASRARVWRLERRRAKIRRGVMVALSVLTVAALGAGAWAGVKQREAVIERDQSRLNEGLAWMLRARVALEQGYLYPDTLLYAAQAIGFDGVGRSPNLGAGDEPLRFLREDRDAEQYQSARDWIASRPAYRPLWSSGNRPEMPVTALAVDPSGRWLALGSEGGVRLFELPAGGKEAALPEVSGVTDLAFSPDGDILAIAAADGVRLWVLEERRFRENPVGSVSSLAWSPDRAWLAGAGKGGSVLLWKSGEGEAEVIPGGGVESVSVVSLTFSPENAFLAGVLPSAGPRIWFPDHGAAASAWTELRADEETLAKLDERDRPEFQNRVVVASTATSVAVSPDGMTLATGTRETEVDADGEEITRGGLILWDAAAAGIVARVSPEQRHNKGVVRSVAFRADGRQLASGAEDGTIKLWAVSDDSLRLIATLTGHRGAVTRLAYGPGETLLASAGADGSAKLWDVSGLKAESLDLFAYREKRWYGFAPELAWEEGGGFLNESAGALVAHWRASEEPDAAATLIAQVEKAAGEKRWRQVALLEKELKALRRALPEELAAGLVSALPKEDPKLRDSFINGEGMELLWCPRGTFQMGSPEGEEGRDSDETLHEVTLTSGFWLGQTEVTQAQWIAVMGGNPSTNKPSGLDAPVENVSWDEAMEYCRRLTDRERARGAIPPGWDYRLPTEAQWEYACRAGTETAWSFGNDKSQPHRYGNYKDDSEVDDRAYAAPVKRYEPNPWGFYDMHGNVWEWCLDRAEAYDDGSTINPVGTSGSLRVGRGGGYVAAPADCRSADRVAFGPSGRNGALGLRPALVPSSQPVP